MAGAAIPPEPRRRTARVRAGGSLAALTGGGARTRAAPRVVLPGGAAAGVARRPALARERWADQRPLAGAGREGRDEPDRPAYPALRHRVTEGSTAPTPLNRPARRARRGSLEQAGDAHVQVAFDQAHHALHLRFGE